MQPHIRGGILEFFPATVAALGGDALAMLGEADVAREVLSIPGIYLPYANYMRLLDIAARNTNCPQFGLLMSRSANAETLGTTGIIMAQATSLGGAWDALTHFYSLHDTYAAAAIQRCGSTAILSYGLPRNDRPGTRQVYDVAAGIIFNIMRQFCGAGFRALEVKFPYIKPESLSAYAALPVRHLKFGSQALEVHLPIGLLQQPLAIHYDESRLQASSYFRLPPPGGSGSASQVVEDMIRRLLPTGECTLPVIAATLSVAVRTLQVRLDSEQSSFRILLEKVRREIAAFHLRRGDMQLTQLAMVLGYSELSAFSRSFRGWHGVSPRQWLRQQGF